jgi:diaminopimelate decarboxylase
MNPEIIQTIASRHGTPFYLYEEATILNQIQKVKRVMKGLQNHLTYALKANSNVEILRIIQQEGLGMEIATPGELAYAIQTNGRTGEMIWNSNGKTPEHIRWMMERGIGSVNIDSLEEMDLWGNQRQIYPNFAGIRFFLRINPNIDPLTHPYLSTGLINSKFGIQEHMIPLAIQKASELSIPLVGFHAHIGSQITTTAPLREIYTRMFALSRQYGFNQVNLGGGWGIPYLGQSLDLTEIGTILHQEGQNFHITFELGRFIVGEAGTYITKVISTKWSGSRHFVVLDGGMNHLIRPVLYGAVHPFEFLGERTEYCEDFDIVGPLCESGDILVKNAKGNLPKAGSLVTIKMTGAYGYSMASNYNGTGRPAEILIRCDGTIQEIRTREKL